jgi:hypothetical protein
VFNGLWPLFWVGRLALLKYLIGSVAESGKSEDLECFVGSKLLKMTGDFLAEADDGALVGSGGDAFKELLVLAVFGGVVPGEVLNPENFLQVVKDDETGLVCEFVDEVVDALGEIEGWLQDAAEVGDDVSIEEFGEGSVTLEALPDDVVMLVLLDKLASEGGFSGAVGGVDQDEAAVVFDPGLELGEFGGATIEGEEGWGIEEVFLGCSIDSPILWISLVVNGDIGANINTANLHKSI